MQYGFLFFALLIFSHVKQVESKQTCGSINCVNGNCVTVNGTNSCNCKSGYTGKLCDTDINECVQNVCKNGGTCINKPGSYECKCMKGFEGDNCWENKDDCYPNSCKNGAVCIDMINGYHCNCTDKHTGLNCTDIIGVPQCKKLGFEGPADNCTDRNECEQFKSMCNYGKCINTIGSFKCDCASGFKGKRCNEQVKHCGSSPCLNGGTCTENWPDSYYCVCNKPFTGPRCNITIIVCKPGFTGKNCDIKINLCVSYPCANNGTCIENQNSFNYSCHCRPGFTGPNCSVCACQNGGRCSEKGCICQKGFIGKHCDTQIKVCHSNPCKNNGTCVENGSSYFCNCSSGFTGSRCSVQVKTCQYKECSTDFDGGICQPQCNIHDCDWDGTDCSLGISPWQNCTVSSKKCYEVFNDNKCDPECNNLACLYDGLDCEVQKKCEWESYCKEHFNNSVCEKSCNNPECGYDNLKCDPNGQAKLVPGFLVLVLLSTKENFQNKKNEFLRKLSIILNTNVIIVSINIWKPGNITKRSRRDSTVPKLEVKFRLNNQQCSKNCFETTQSAANYLAAKQSTNSLMLPVPVYSAVASKGKPPPVHNPPIPSWMIIIIAITIPVVIGVALGGRKVVASLWVPEGARGKRRESPVGQEEEEMHSLRQTSSICSSHDSESPVEPKRVRLGPLKDEWLNFQSSRSNNWKVSESETDDGSVPSPTAMIYTTDKTQLHHAALNLQTTVARRLIEYGCDVNARDSGGRSPLHLSVAAVADGVFQLLLHNRACQFDLQSFGGMTALMDACRLGVDLMAEDLVSAGAKVNIIDDSGKTALHHAALVNNHKSVHTLLKNGAKVDAQDNKGQTALLLAANDGGLMTVRILLSHFANRSVGDNMDVCPIEAADKKGHHDVVKLIRDFTTYGGSPHAIGPYSPPYSIDTSPVPTGNSPTPVGCYDILPKLSNNTFQLEHVLNSKPPGKRKRKATSRNNSKSKISHKTFQGNHRPKLVNICEYPTPRPSTENQFPDLSDSDVLQGMEGMEDYQVGSCLENHPSANMELYPNYMQQQQVSIGAPVGERFGFEMNLYPKPFTNPVVNLNNILINNDMLRDQLNHQQFSMYEMSVNPFPTPPSAGIQSPGHGLCSPVDINSAQPSPFLTPSPESWTTSPGHSTSESSVC